MPPSVIILIAITVAIVVVGAGLAVFVRERDDRRAMERGDETALARAGRARDVDGRTVKLIDPLPLHALGRDDVIERAALEKIVEELEPGFGRRKIVVLIALLGAGMLVLVGLSMAMKGPIVWQDVLGALANPAIFAGVIGGAVVPIIAARAERLRRVRSVMLRHRCCPHCGYGLDGVPGRPADGATVCPECACVWRLEAVGRDVAASAARKPDRAATIALIVGLAALAAGLLVFMLMR